MINQKRCLILTCIFFIYGIHTVTHEQINFKIKQSYEYENIMSVEPVHCIHFSTKSPSWMMHFCHCFIIVRSPFQQYVNSSFSWAMLSDAIPWSVILFLDQGDKTRFHHPLHWYEWRKSSPSTVYPSSNCEETYFCWHLCSSISKEETQQTQTFQYPELSSSPGWQSAKIWSLLPLH